MKSKNPVSVITFYNGSTKQSAVLAGHLSTSEVERQMLFQKHVPKCKIDFAATIHKFV